MAIEILANGDDSRAIMFCNTTEWAFGPVHYSPEDVATDELNLFVNTLPCDAREYSSTDLEREYYKFRNIMHNCNDCGTPILNDVLCEDCLDVHSDN